eukprot:1221432-Rhodomonas_salina.1
MEKLRYSSKLKLSAVTALQICLQTALPGYVVDKTELLKGTPYILVGYEVCESRVPGYPGVPG